MSFPCVSSPAANNRLDPDGNPDTSFLVKIPADVAWTFQTLDKNGMVLNMAQTWHQVRPGEVRSNCGGCHAHSQKPTKFKDTAAAQRDYPIFDLTSKTPLLTSKQHDQSGKQWDVKDTTGLRLADRVLNVEYHRDIKPILERSCVACHTQKWDKPAGNLVLDDDRPMQARRDSFGGRRLADLPGTFVRLAKSTRWASLATSRRRAVAGARHRATSAISSRAAVCSPGRSTVNAWTAG